MTYGTAQTTGNDRSQKDAYQHNKTWWGYYAAAGVGIGKEIKKFYDEYLIGVDKKQYYDIGLKFNRTLKLQVEVKKIYVAQKKNIDKIVIEMSKIGVTNNYYNQLYQKIPHESLTSSLL